MADEMRCTVCGFKYYSEDGLEREGIAPGTAWEDIPDDWECPVCGLEKDGFSEE